MLNSETFKAGINKLVIEYGDKGFTMSKEKAEQWYARFKNISDADFSTTIKNVLDFCSFSPCMADLVKNIEKNRFDGIVT
jgi:hypothetical protein